MKTYVLKCIESTLYPDNAASSRLYNMAFTANIFQVNGSMQSVFLLQGKTALLIVYEEGHLEFVSCLLAHQTGIETSHQSDNIAMCYACYKM